MIILNSLDKNEVLLYLGYRGGGITKRLSDKIDRCLKEAIERIEISCTYKKFSVENSGDGIKVKDTGLTLQGNDVNNFLSFSKEIIFSCVTVGKRVEIYANEVMDEDAEKGLILDVCGSVAVEMAMRECENKLRAEFETGEIYLSLRFGAGYGDFPMKVQENLAEILELDKLGVTVNDDYLLSPSKTLTGIFGLMSQPVKDRGATCDICKFVVSCGLKQDGAKCKCVREPEESTEEVPIIEEKELIKADIYGNKGSQILQRALSALDKGELLLTEVLYIADNIRKFVKSSTMNCSDTQKQKIIICTPYGDSYTTGKNIMKVILEALGYEVTDLGAGVENEVLRKAVVSESPDYVFISILMPASVKSLTEAVKTVKCADSRCRIIVSGGMLTEGEAEEMGADMLVRNLKEIIYFSIDTATSVC